MRELDTALICQTVADMVVQASRNRLTFIFCFRVATSRLPLFYMICRCSPQVYNRWKTNWHESDIVRRGRVDHRGQMRAV